MVTASPRKQRTVRGNARRRDRGAAGPGRAAARQLLLALLQPVCGPCPARRRGRRSEENVALQLWPLRGAFLNLLPSGTRDERPRAIGNGCQLRANVQGLLNAIPSIADRAICFDCATSCRRGNEWEQARRGPTHRVRAEASHLRGRNHFCKRLCLQLIGGPWVASSAKAKHWVCLVGQLYWGVRIWRRLAGPLQKATSDMPRGFGGENEVRPNKRVEHASAAANKRINGSSNVGKGELIRAPAATTLAHLGTPTWVWTESCPQSHIPLCKAPATNCRAPQATAPHTHTTQGLC